MADICHPEIPSFCFAFQLVRANYCIADSPSAIKKVDEANQGDHIKTEEQQKLKKQRVIDMEQHAGRTGGDSGRQIIYDDAAIEKLLDRCDCTSYCISPLQFPFSHLSHFQRSSR